MTTRDKGMPLPSWTVSHLPDGPHLYPRMLRRVADALDALNRLGDDDPSRQESTLFLGSLGIAIFDEEAADDDDDLAGLVGWLTLVDHNCWVFVPHISPLELERLAKVGRDLPRAREHRPRPKATP